ncbi:MAG: transglutaminase-like domain-containing protein [archaeon]
MKSRNALACFLIILLASFVSAESFYPTTIADLNSTVRLTGYGTISDLKPGEDVSFQTLTFQESQLQDVKVIREVLYINNEKIFPNYTLDEFGNKYVNFKINQNGSFNYEIVAEIHTRSVFYNLTDYNLSITPPSVDQYIKPSEKVESDSTEILTLTNSKLPKNSFLGNLNDTVSWVNDYVEYARGDDFQRYYLLQKTAKETLLDKKGVCDEFANLAAAMLRAKGIPTRLAIGITFDGEQWGNHAWLEVWHKNAGWVPTDPTFRETGFVDATHIKIGSFTDVSLSLAKAVFPRTADVFFQTQTIPDVNISSKGYFGEADIASTFSELKQKQWNNIELIIKNNSTARITIPVRIKENYNDILVENTSQGIILNPAESGKVVFRVYPNIDLKEGEYAKGTLTFNTLNIPYERDFTIVRSDPLDNGSVVVKDITPIASSSSIIIRITAANYKIADSNIDFNLTSGKDSYAWSERVPSFTEQVYSKDAPFYHTALYELSASTESEKLTQKFYPTMQKIQIADPEVKETVVQEVTPPKKDQIQVIVENPEVIVIALFLGMAVIIFGVYLVKKRYI